MTLRTDVLHAGEQKRLRNAIGDRVHQLAKKEPGARPVLFRSLYRSLREEYNVESYKEIHSHQLLAVLNFVSGWGGEAIEARKETDSR